MSESFLDYPPQMIEDTPVDRLGISPSVTLTDNISSRRPGAPTREHLPALLPASSPLISNPNIHQDKSESDGNKSYDCLLTQ